MAPSRALRQTLSTCSSCARLPFTPHRSFATSGLLYNEGSHLPRVADPSLWRSLVPKALRRDGGDDSGAKKPRSKEWNPATIFIVLGILVGSNAINILALRREMVNFSRKTEAKLAGLREVLQRVKNGEDVDVERMLGTGNPQQEKEWEDVMNEIEKTDTMAEAKRKREVKAAEKEAAKLAELDAAKMRSSEKGGPDGASSGKPRFMM
ncbi:hypothetical protein WHR41_03292 [Cladosporium halotolerans]|uniref:Uncharacterized protein n=1 Tax=Cladosporium halotolerans TaxID=1052096 RepID=A0AB34KWQ6_9PEZI